MYTRCQNQVSNKIYYLKNRLHESEFDLTLKNKNIYKSKPDNQMLKCKWPLCAYKHLEATGSRVVCLTRTDCRMGLCSIVTVQSHD